MKILIGYESSGVVRDAFRHLGHDAYSCDLLSNPSEYHLQGDIADYMHDDWDLGIFHPPCTYLTVSAAWAFKDGPYHQNVKAGTLVGAARREAREMTLNNVRTIMNLPYPKAIENPIGAISSAIRKPNQIIQPYQFGHNASKATCLWLDRLPPLVPTKRIRGRFVQGKERFDNQTDSGQNKLTPSKDRWKTRSETYAGIAQAMAEQWSKSQ